MAPQQSKNPSSSSRYRVLFEAAPDAGFVLSTSPPEVGKILEANSLAAEMHGYTSAELLTMNIGDLDVPEDAELVEQRIGQLLRDGRIHFEATHRRKDGSTFPVEVSARLAEIDGQSRVVTFNRDITARRDIEHQLKEQVLRTKLAASASRVGFWDWNIRDDSIYFSPEWKAQLGYAHDELDDEFDTWKSRLFPDDAERVLAQVDDHLAGRTDIYETEFRLRHKDGSYRWIYVRGDAMRDDGVAVRFVGCHVDITERKRNEAERTAMLRRLNQMQRLEAIGTLAGGIAHDFNNILSIIAGNVELAEVESDPAELQESLAEIRKAGDRAKALVRQILSFSRNETLERRTTPVDALVGEAVRLVRSTVQRRIDVVAEIDDDAPDVMADAEQLTQVLVNLGTNAWQAIGDGTGRITFRARRTKLPAGIDAAPQLAEADYAVLEVTDDGPGMAEEVLERMFEPFFTTKPPGKGSGLGLSVVNGIVRNHDGAIDVESAIGRGTTFRVYLPEATDVERMEAGLEAWCGPANLHVLLVDDEPHLLRALGRGLERFGFRVTTYEDPQQALHAMTGQRLQVDVLVTDYDMPSVDGIELSRTLRNRYPSLPIVLCSGFLDTEASYAASQAGVDRVIAKPVVAKQLAECIRAVHLSRP